MIGPIAIVPSSYTSRGLQDTWYICGVIRRASSGVDAAEGHNDDIIPSTTLDPRCSVPGLTNVAPARDLDTHCHQVRL